MNFEPRIILAPQHGNNADAKAVSVRVMNQREPSPAQLAELAFNFEQHTVKVRNGLAGFVVSDGLLSDGSRFRAVTNSGMHMLMIWPAGGVLLLPLYDWFRTIPTSDTLINGTGDKPSEAWKIFGGVSGGWPDDLTPTSLRVDHPGHITWINEDLTFERKPIVLAWRGPRDRYACTTGFAGTTGGGIIAHERSPYGFPTAIAFADEVLVDTGYVWINGHKVDTGLTKIIAACLYQYDSVGDPGKFVLRVITDDNSSTRQMVCHDLVPDGVTDGASLQSFATATATLDIKDSYVATDNSNDANGIASATVGIWDYWQRPHFNKSGTRIATLITKVGSNGTDRETHAVSFDPTDWSFDDDITASYTGSWSTTYVGSFIDYTSEASGAKEFLIAADFEGDAFVYMKLTAAQEFEEQGRDDGNLTINVYAGYHDFQRAVTYTIEHSLMGTLKSWLIEQNYHISYTQTAGPPGTVHIEGEYEHTVTDGWKVVNSGEVYIEPKIAMIGNLSKRMFAIGYPEQGTSEYSAVGVVSANIVAPAYPLIPVTGTATRGRMVFDVYFDGEKVVDGETVGFTNTADATTSDAFDASIQLATTFTFVPHLAGTDNTQGVYARMWPPAALSLGPPSYEGRWDTGIAARRAVIYADTGAAPLYQHCAVHPQGKAAYFGGAYFLDDYGNTAVVQGLEATVVISEASPVVESPPVYITGGHPTMSVPVFMGTAPTGTPP